MPKVTFPAPAGPLPGCLATPTTEGPWPAAIVVQDVRGMTADVRRISDRLAAAGYLTLAPALYGRGPKIHCMLSTNDFGIPAPFNVIERIAGMEYSEPEAEDAWRRILTFFGEHLR